MTTIERQHYLYQVQQRLSKMQAELEAEIAEMDQGQAEAETEAAIENEDVINELAIEAEYHISGLFEYETAAA